LRREFPDTEIKIYLDPDPQKGGKNIFPLRSGNIRIGSLEMVFPEARMSTGHREGIRLLAGEIASAFERCRLLERQFKLREELARKNHLEDLGRMAATIAHNVKNPLSSMKTLIQLQIEAENLTPDQKGELQMMLEEINRLAKTVTSLLRFSKIDAPLSSDPSESGLTSLQSIVDSVVGVYEGDLHTREITTNLFVDSDTLIPKSKSEAVRDILSNLISNAIEASDDKGMIHLELRKEGGFIVLVLQDEGRGIPEQIRDRIMDPFVTTKQSGTGLGLAIVQRRVEQLQGKIEIESPLQMGGARFTVTFPA
jgi:signal transduction histidine kinase